MYVQTFQLYVSCTHSSAACRSTSAVLPDSACKDVELKTVVRYCVMMVRGSSRLAHHRYVLLASWSMLHGTVEQHKTDSSAKKDSHLWLHCKTQTPEPASALSTNWQADHGGSSSSQPVWRHGLCMPARGWHRTELSALRRHSLGL